jgi:hypothetical protein
MLLLRSCLSAVFLDLPKVSIRPSGQPLVDLPRTGPDAWLWLEFNPLPFVKIRLIPKANRFWTSGM